MRTWLNLGGNLLEDRQAIQNWRRVLDLSIWALVVATLALPLWFFYAGNEFQTVSKRPPSLGASQRAMKVEGIERWMALSHRKLWIPMPAIEEQIKFFECNDRPDQAEGEKNIFLGLESSGERRAVAAGEKIFVACNDLNRVAFTEERTPFQIEFSLLKNGSLEAILHAQFLGQDSVAVQEGHRRFVLPKVNRQAGSHIAPIFDQLNQGVRILSPDRLLELYGGEAFAEEKGRYRFVCEEGKKVFHVREGEYLIWSEGQWLQEEGDTKGKPLLFIKTLSRQRCDYQLWDEKGVVSKTGSLPVIATHPPFTQSQETFDKIHYRTDNSVTCQMGKKNVILRSGDWVVKSKSGWKSIQTLEDLKILLARTAVGDLFIFDGIIERDGKKIFKGHYFDADRITAQVVELSLKEKKDRKNSKKRINLSSANPSSNLVRQKK